MSVLRCRPRYAAGCRGRCRRSARGAPAHGSALRARDRQRVPRDLGLAVSRPSDPPVPSDARGWREAWVTFTTLEPASRPTGMGSMPMAGVPSGAALQGPGAAWQGPGAAAPVLHQINGPAVASLVLGI